MAMAWASLVTNLGGTAIAHERAEDDVFDGDRLISTASELRAGVESEIVDAKEDEANTGDDDKVDVEPFDADWKSEGTARHLIGRTSAACSCARAERSRLRWLYRHRRGLEHVREPLQLPWPSVYEHERNSRTSDAVQRRCEDTARPDRASMVAPRILSSICKEPLSEVLALHASVSMLRPQISTMTAAGHSRNVS